MKPLRNGLYSMGSSFRETECTVLQESQILEKKYFIDKKKKKKNVLSKKYLDT